MLSFAPLWVSYGTGMAWKTGKVVNSGVPWFDDRGEIANAHGACIVEENGRYYLFEEYGSGKSNASPGFSCYSSDDSVNWKFERAVLSTRSNRILGPDRVGERVKVMKRPSIGKYVMYMYTDDISYKDSHIGYATCSTIADEYKPHGPLLYEGRPTRCRDMGAYQDTDDTGYLLLYGGIVYCLDKDHRTTKEKMISGVDGSRGESPAVFRKDGAYLFLFSNLTSWEKNDNFCFIAPSVRESRARQGLFAPEGSLTYSSQTTLMFLLKCGEDMTPIFMGDRRPYPHQTSVATYVWMPMWVDGTKLSVPEYWPFWDVNKSEPVNPSRKGKTVGLKKVAFNKEADWEVEEGRISSNVKGSTPNIPFTDSCMTVMGETDCHSRYARMGILDKKGEKIYSLLVDFCSKANDHATRFKTSQLAEGEYTLAIEITDISPIWTDKTKRVYGSDGCFVIATGIVKL